MNIVLLIIGVLCLVGYVMVTWNGKWDNTCAGIYAYVFLPVIAYSIMLKGINNDIVPISLTTFWHKLLVGLLLCILIFGGAFLTSRLTETRGTRKISAISSAREIVTFGAALTLLTLI